MDITQEQYDQIQRYLDGDMDAAEKTSFLREVAINNDLKESLELEEQLRNASFLLYENNDELRGEIKAAGEEWRKEQLVVRPRKYVSLWMWSASIAAALLLLTWLLMPAKRASNRELFAEFYKVLPTPDNKPEQLLAALSKYDEKDYDGVKQLSVDDIPQSRGEEDYQQVIAIAHLYKGVSFIATGDYVGAGYDLQWVVSNSRSTDLVSKAKWYLALVKLRMDKAEEAKQLLKEMMVECTPFYQRQAAGLLRKLE